MKIRGRHIIGTLWTVTLLAGCGPIAQETHAPEEAHKTQALQEVWRNSETGTVYRLTREGKTLKAEAQPGEGENRDEGYVLRADIDGSALEGVITVPARRHDYCDLPEETSPLTGRISEDGRSIEVQFQQSEYKTAARWVEASGGYECAGVTVLQEMEQTLTLTQISQAEDR